MAKYSVSDRKINRFQQPRKSQKRKADTTTPTANDQLSESPPVSDVTRPRRDSTRPSKQPKRDSLQPDSQHFIGGGLETGGTGISKRQDQLRFCARLVREMLSKKHLAYAWPFHKPVDAKALNLHDYHDIIKHPMDLSTIKVILSLLKLWSLQPDWVLCLVFCTVTF